MVPPECPFWERHVTLACVYKGELRYCHNWRDKEDLLKDAPAFEADGAVYFVAWTGKWTTNLFTLTKDDIQHFRTGRDVSGMIPRKYAEPEKTT